MNDKPKSPDLYPNEFLRTVIGSTIHGLNVVGTDDLDLMGICLEPPEVLLGLGKFEQHTWRSQPEGVPSGAGDIDLVVYGLRKWMRLCVGGNPTVTNLLFVPESQRMHDSWIAKKLRDYTPYLLGRKTSGKAYLGYCEAQRQRLLGIRGGRSVRPQKRWVEGTTYDTKYAMHMIRLAMQGVELLETGKVSLPMQEEQRAYCYAVRVGEVEQKEVLAKTAELEDKMKVLIESSKALAERPNIDAANEFLIKSFLWRDRREDEIRPFG